MPVGVVVSTSTVPTAGSNAPVTGSGYFLTGLTQRGNPNSPVHVLSLLQAQTLLGDRVTYGFVWDDLQTFFGEGGTDAWVQRVVGPNATAGSITLTDGSTPTPLPTLQLYAGAPTIDPMSGVSLGNVQDPGDWSTAISVQVVASAITDQWRLLVFYNGSQVESFGPFATVAAAVSAINSESGYLYAVNEFSTGNSPNPAVTTNPSSLSAGNDDRTNITASSYTAALANFPQGLGPGAVAIPGMDASLVGAGVQAHGTANGRAAILFGTQGMPSAAVQSAAASFRGQGGGQENGGYFWPWVTVPDGAGGQRTISPAGFVAGVRSRTVAQIGPWQAPAGNWGAAQFITGLDSASGIVTDAIGNALNDESVNVIRPRSGLRLFGWRSLSTDQTNWKLLNQADTMNVVGFQIQQALQVYDFAIIDGLGQLAAAADNTVLSVLEPLITANALYPGPATSTPTSVNGSGANTGTTTTTSSDPGYLIDTGSDVNPPSLLAQDEFAVAVYLRLSPTAELIQAGLYKVGLNSQI